MNVTALGPTGTPASNNIGEGMSSRRKPSLCTPLMVAQYKKEHRRLPDRCAIFVIITDTYAYPCFKYFVECRHPELLPDLSFWRSCLSFNHEPTPENAKAIAEKFLVQGAPKEIKIPLTSTERAKAIQDATLPNSTSTTTTNITFDKDLFTDLCEAVLDELAAQVYQEFLVEFPNFVMTLQIIPTNASINPSTTEDLTPQPLAVTSNQRRSNSSAGAIQLTGGGSGRRQSTCNVAFGVRRGNCTQQSCDCHGYRSKATPGIPLIDIGGACLNCIAEGSLVSLSNGLGIPIEKVAKHSFIQCLDGKQIINTGRTSCNPFINGERNCLCLKLIDNSTLRLTPDHQVLVVSKEQNHHISHSFYVKAENIDPSHHLICCSSIGSIKSDDNEMNDWSFGYKDWKLSSHKTQILTFARILACLLSSSSNMILTFTNYFDAESALNDIFMFVPRETVPNLVTKKANYWLISLPNVPFISIFKSCGINSTSFSSSSSSQIIPNFVQYAPSVFKREFFATFWGRNGVANEETQSPNAKFIQQLQISENPTQEDEIQMNLVKKSADFHLKYLQQFGIEAKITEAKYFDSNSNCSYFENSIIISEDNSLGLFAEQIGIRYSIANSIKFELYRRWDSYKKRRNHCTTFKEFANLIHYNNSTTTLFIPVISKSKEEKPMKVYDLSVGGYNNFVVEGMIVHNCGHVPATHLNLGELITDNDIPPPPLPPQTTTTEKQQQQQQQQQGEQDIPPPPYPPPPFGASAASSTHHAQRTLSQDITSDRPHTHTPSSSLSGQASPLVPRSKQQRSSRNDTPPSTTTSSNEFTSGSSPVVENSLSVAVSAGVNSVKIPQIQSTSSQMQQQIAPPLSQSATATAAGGASAGGSGAQWFLDKSEITLDQTPLGVGRSATVYRGKWRNQEVAVKILKEESETKTVEDFKLEFQFLSSLRSPHFVYFYGVVLDPPRMWLLLEYCSRGSLNGFMQKTDVNFTWDLFFKFAQEAALGLSCLHNWKPQIVHRDFKSHNLLITENWQLKISDFGLSRFLGNNAETLQKVRGTYAYSCPEVYFGKQCTDKSDVFSLGIVLWEMVTRCIKGEYIRPYSDNNDLQFDFQILLRVSKHDLRPTIPANCPNEVTSLLKVCYAGDPQIRPTASSAHSAILTLENLYKTKTQKKWDKIREKKKK